MLFLFLLKFTLLDLFFITAHRKASKCMGGISVCLSVRLSVCHTPVSCQNEKERRKMQSLPPVSTVPLVFSCQEWLMEDDPVWLKVECKEVDPCENSRAVHISPHNSGTVIDSENSLGNANRKSNMGFPTSHQLRSCITPDFPKLVFRCQICSFFAEISIKTITNMLQSFILSKNFLRQSCSAINYLSNGINIWQGMTPFP